MKKLNNISLAALLITALISGCSSVNNAPIINQSINSSSTAPAKNKLNHKKYFSISKLPASLNPETKKATDAISKVLSGVELVSEADYEFSVSVWQNQKAEKFTAQKLLETLKLNKKLKCEEQKKTVQGLLGDYATKEYWEGSGYSDKEIAEKITKYKSFIKEVPANLKNIQIFYVDDPQNIDSEYDPSGDYSGKVGVYILGRVGNDIVVLDSAYVWT